MIASPFDTQLPREIDAATGLPIGPRLADAGPAGRPEKIVLEGRHCRLEPLDPARHGDDLYRCATAPDRAARFLYLAEDPPESRAQFQAWLANATTDPDRLFFAVIDKRSGRAEGRQAFLRIDPPQRSIEIGSIYWGSAIARSTVATEANYLFAAYAFGTLGYRRYEWKCDALNAPSRASAGRFGFRFEGHFRRASIVNGRSRDTTWFSIIDEEWPQLRGAYQAWLAAGNFDAEGRQWLALSALTCHELAGDGALLTRATTRDLASLETLQKAAYAPNARVLGVEPIPTAADYHEVLASKEVWLAKAGNRLDGALILEPHPDHLLIWSIATDPARQRSRLGRRLLAAAEIRARDLGLTAVKLYTGTRLTHLVDWYGRHGFVTDRIEQRADRSITHMTKSLSPDLSQRAGAAS